MAEILQNSKSPEINFLQSAAKKKYMFELAISEKLAGLRWKDPKAFWNLLKEGFGNNKVGDIEMSEWHDHFSKLFLHTNTGMNLAMLR